MRGFPQARKAELASVLVVLGGCFGPASASFFAIFFVSSRT